MTGALPAALAQLAIDNGPIFRLRASDGEYPFLVGPEANRFVMHTHRDHFSHNLGWTPLVGDWLGVGLLNMDVPDHTVHRRLMNPAFTSSYLSSYFPLMETVVNARTRDWIDRGVVDAQIEAREIAFDIAGVALAGFPSGPESDRLREIFYALLHGFDDSTETFEDFLKRRTVLIDELDASLLATISRRRQLPDAEQPRDVLARVIHATDDRAELLSNSQILAHVKVLLLAGHETTTALASWVLWLISTHQTWRERIESELTAAVGEADEGITIDQIRSLKSLDLVIREAGRLYSPVLNVPRGVLAEFEFGGFQVPARESIRLSIAGCHRLPSVFSQPNVFDPERFESPRDEDAKTPYGLVTFGGGPRTCLGMSFAQLEVKALVTHVLRRFRFEPVSPREIVYAGFWTGFAPGGILLKVSGRPD